VLRIRPQESNWSPREKISSVTQISPELHTAVIKPSQFVCKVGTYNDNLPAALVVLCVSI
jgi:hypothetical protein